MESKNYYQLLGVRQDASSFEIRIAYRRLALQYHPDKNAENLLAEQMFKEINEAYAVLSDKQKRAVYQRDNFKHYPIVSKEETKPVTASTIYELICEIRKDFENADPYRMDNIALQTRLEQLFSAYNVSILKIQNNTTLNKAIVAQTLAVLRLLPIAVQQKIIATLKKIAQDQQATIDHYMKQQLQIHFWEKYKMLFVLMVAVIICLFMYFFIKK